MRVRVASVTTCDAGACGRQRGVAPGPSVPPRPPPRVLVPTAAGLSVALRVRSCSCGPPSLGLAPREDLGFRFICEQVSHHPPVSAFHSEGLQQDFLFHGSIYPKLRFWGKSVEAEPRGTITLELLR